MAMYMRRLLAIIGTGALLLSLIAIMPGDGSAANLTGGTYTYVINGDEATFPVDPVVRKDGVLLPVEVFQKFNITVEGALTRNVTLKRGTVTTRLTLGSTTIDVNGRPETVASAPLRLNGRLFVPGDLMKQYGIDFSQDTNMVVLKDNADGAPPVKTLEGTDFAALKSGRIVSSTAVKADSNIYFNAEFTLLSADIVMAANWDITYATRIKLLNLLQTNSLVLAKVSNTSFKAGALVTSGLYLVDSNRKQYDLASVQDVGEGMVNLKVAPGADRAGVLVFPKLTAAPGVVSIFYDTAAGVIGSFTTTP